MVCVYKFWFMNVLNENGISSAFTFPLSVVWIHDIMAGARAATLGHMIKISDWEWQSNKTDGPWVSKTMKLRQPSTT